MGEGGNTAEDVHRFNNSRFAYSYISEQSLLSGGDGNDIIVTAQSTTSTGGAGVDTFVIRDPSLPNVSAYGNVIMSVGTLSENIILTYAGDTAPEQEDISFERTQVRELPGSGRLDERVVINLQVNDETYATFASYAYQPQIFGGDISLASFEQMLVNGRFNFVADSEVDALIQAEAAKALISELR